MSKTRIPSVLSRARPIAQTKHYATVRGLSSPHLPEPEEPDPSNNDFILSIVRSNPSIRDSKSYIGLFGPKALPKQQNPPLPLDLTLPPAPSVSRNPRRLNVDTVKASPVVSSILNPITRRTALVKMQGPFTDKQLDSICRGMVYLEKLGLVSVIVVELDDWVKGEPDEKSVVVEETMRIVHALEKQGARARPVLQTVVRLGPKPSDELDPSTSRDFSPPEAHTTPDDLVAIRSALRAGEIPVVPPVALDSFCRGTRIDSNHVIGALARGMAEAGTGTPTTSPSSSHPLPSDDDVDLTPLRLMIINREGGIPSYARTGLPHLLVNVDAEYDYIRNTFHPSWQQTHPTAFSNLALARTCLSYMPSHASAIMVSHRSPRSLIANLITNRPEVSSSLPHALLQGNRKVSAETPTILRRGLPIQVINNARDLDKSKLKHLLEQSFRRTLDGDAFWERLDKTLDFAIVAGDYAGAAIVTNEPSNSPGGPPIAYLDKFAVLPSHQGDGTVDFLWVALHDESYGLGLSYSVNANGGKNGRGQGRDLVWRSRADNPINKWYFERSTGHLRMGNWVMFWCDAEKRLKTEESRRGSTGLSYVEGWENGRLSNWSDVIQKIPSSWTK